MGSLLDGQTGDVAASLWLDKVETSLQVDSKSLAKVEEDYGIKSFDVVSRENFLILTTSPNMKAST